MRGGCRAPRCPSLLPEDHPRALLTATTTVPVSSLGGGFPPSGRCLRNQQFPPASFLWMKYKSRHRDASGRSRHRVAQAGGRAPNGKPRRSLELAGQPLTTCSRSPMCSARCSVKGAGREGRGVGLGPLWGGLGWGPWRGGGTAEWRWHGTSREPAVCPLEGSWVPTSAPWPSSPARQANLCPALPQPSPVLPAGSAAGPRPPGARLGPRCHELECFLAQLPPPWQGYWGCPSPVPGLSPANTD